VTPALAKYAEHYFHWSLKTTILSGRRVWSMEQEQNLFAAEDSEFAIMNWSSTR